MSLLIYRQGIVLVEIDESMGAGSNRINGDASLLEAKGTVEWSAAEDSTGGIELRLRGIPLAS
jgi:hypothetical protein